MITINSNVGALETVESDVDGIIVIDVRVLQSVMNSKDPDCPYFQAFIDAHNANTAVKELSGTAKSTLIEKKQVAYDKFVLECRVTKEKYDGFEFDPLWDETTRRLENEATALKNKLNEVVAYSRPLPSSFPTKKELDTYEKKKAAAETAFQKKQNELIGHQQDANLRVAEINRNRIHMAQLVEREKSLRLELQRLPLHVSR